VGTFCVSDTSVMVTRNVDAMLDEESTENFYRISNPCYPSKDLTDMLKKSIDEAGLKVHSGNNATTDSFYCSQGRIQDAFVDHNDSLLETLRTKHQVRTLEMETYQLFHLAKCAVRDPNNSIKAASVKMIVANRSKDAFLACEDARRKLEMVGGLFCLNALKNFDL